MVLSTQRVHRAPGAVRGLSALAMAAGLLLAGAWAPPAASASAATTPPAADLAALAFAKAQLGKPYEWGAAGPDSYDCSGLTYASYRSAGITLPRTSATQYGAGSHVPLAALLPGDLVFWASDVNRPETIYHVAMYVGNGYMIDAPHTGTVVQIQPMYTTNLLPQGTRPNTPSALRISASPSIYYGDYARVDGRLVSAINGAPLAGLPVGVYARRVGSSAWTQLAVLSTDSVGLVHYVRAIGGNAEFALWFPGALGYAGASSPVATTAVVAMPTALRVSANPTSITLGQVTTVSGRLVSALNGSWQGGQPVRVYARRLGTTSWTLLATLTTAADGLVSYSRAIGGTAEFQLSYAGDSIRQPTASAVLRVDVH